MKVIIQEYFADEDAKQGQEPVCEYLATMDNDGNSIITRRCPSKNSDMAKRSPPLQLMKDLFLPIGYPHSVDPSYLPYQLYDGLQGLCSYWRGVVSTKAVYEAAGVGNAEATAMSAAMNWALRDGAGMIGGLAYSYVCSPYFDSYPLEFRLLLADIINDFALTLDMLAPYFMDSSLYILSLSTMFKTICGITAGATKGRITHHFSRHNGNMADLSAKESTQETLVSLLGMIGGVCVAKVLERHDSMLWTWILFGALTLLHVWANYKAVTIIKMTTINPERCKILFQDVVTAMSDQIRQTSDDNHDPTILSKRTSIALQNLKTSEEIQESMLSSLQTFLFSTIHVARSLDKSWNRLVNCTLRIPEEDIQEDLLDMPYVMGYGGGKTIFIWLKVGASIQDEIQAYVHALLLKELLCPVTGEAAQVEYSSKLFLRTFHVIQAVFRDGKSILSQLESKGWDVQTRSYLGFPSLRLKLDISSSKQD